MFNIFKAELFRIFKLKSLRILTIITFVAIIISAAFVKIDQSGAFDFSGVTKIKLTKIIKEGDSSIFVKSDVEKQISLVVPDRLGFKEITKVDLSKGEQEIPLGFKVTKGMPIYTQETTPDGLEMNFPVAITLDKNDNGSGSRALIFKEQYGITNLFTSTNTWYTWIALVIAVIIFAGDFTHKRFKNYLHFVKNRSSILVSKFLATYFSVILLEVLFILFGVILTGLLFGAGLPIDWNQVLVNLLIFKLNLLFIISLIMWLSIMSRSTAATVGLYLAKAIIIPIVLSAVGAILLAAGNNPLINWISDVIEHVSFYGTNAGMISTFFRAVSQNDVGLFFIPIYYWIGYMVFLLSMSFIVFKKSEI